MNKRSLARENEAARHLARLGYRVQQNPSRAEVETARARTGDQGSARSRPDYLVEGRVFDCYAPTTDLPFTAWWTLDEKVHKKRQTQRIILDLRDYGGDAGELRDLLLRRPIAGLKEVIAIMTDGSVVNFY